MNLITSLPFTISNPGIWGLGVGMDAYAVGDAAAITLGCDDITLDGNGEWLINSAEASNQSSAIYGLNRSRCAIRGFQIFGNFKHAIFLENTDGQASEGRNIISDNPRLSGSFRGVRNQTRAAKILRNGIRQVGGGFGPWIIPGTLYAMGIEHLGYDSIIADNVIEDIYGAHGDNEAGESVGISLNRYADGTIVRNNIIRNLTKVPRSMGVWAGDPQHNIRLLDNVIENFKRALFGSTAAGIADGNRTFNCGPLAGEAPHDVFDIPGSDEWTGSNMGA
jgi:hypothetical protein